MFRQAVPADFPEVRRITREAYVRAGHFAADHPYMSVLEDGEHRAEHAQVWVAEAPGKVVAAVMLTFFGEPYSEVARDGELEFRMLAVDPDHQGSGVGRAEVREVVEHARRLPGIEAISIASATFMTRAHSLYRSLGSAALQSGTGTCRARTCCCGCSRWACRRQRAEPSESAGAGRAKARRRSESVQT
ncbi:GNAT family N-acetyltransferase [Arthrobacter sp. NQ7]|uniref:GNAT family N-acetyltransferase n=1 Tax=Arthrobacter sp. NQ7 TaxID=3032303 RepID=UPI0032D97F98